jgi:hypothetical protein
MDPTLFAYLIRRMMQPTQVSVKLDLSAISDLFDQKKIRTTKDEPEVTPLPVSVTNLPSQRPG